MKPKTLYGVRYDDVIEFTCICIVKNIFGEKYYFGYFGNDPLRSISFPERHVFSTYTEALPHTIEYFSKKMNDIADLMVARKQEISKLPEVKK